MKPRILAVIALTLSLCAGLLTPHTAHAQVPGLINYQGRVVDAGTNFDGTGQFKFALVNNSGSTTYWSNGVSAVSLTVTKGLYSVLLGDTTIANMSFVIPATVFSNSDVRLRVWFDDGVNGSQQLSPDQRLGAVGYALTAATVPNGAITSAQIANGAVGAAQLANGAVSSNSIAAASIGAAQIANGAVVKSLNGLNDAVTLSPGANVTISSLGNTLTISSSGGGGGSPTGDVLGARLNIGSGNVLSGTTASIAGGATNTANAAYAFVGGGHSNIASGVGAFVGGGGDDGFGIYGNTASGGGAVVGGGAANVANNFESTVGGGYNNTASGLDGTVVGGRQNSATGPYATVVGGYLSVAGGAGATVVGGGYDGVNISGNQAGGGAAFVGGGIGNNASSVDSVVPGGDNNLAGGTNSFAAGHRAKANHLGAFVWSDTAAADFASTASNQFLIRAGGGVGIGTNNPVSALHVRGTVTATSFSGNVNAVGGLVIENRTNDPPSPVTGQMWLRTDL